MRLCVKNKGEPILPPSIGFLNDKQRAQYKTIFESQKYQIDDPMQSTKMDIDVGNQISLHMHTLKEFTNRGFQIKTIDQHGKETVISFQDLDRIFSELSADEKVKEKIKELRSKRKKRTKTKSL